MTNFHIGFIWSIAELLRGNYKQSEYGKVVLPFTVLRRLDCVLAPMKKAVLAKMEQLPTAIDDTMREAILNQASGHAFHNTSPFTFEKLLDDPEHIAANLNNFVNGFSRDAREIFIDRFQLPEQVARLDRDNLLYLVVSRFAQADLHPDRVSNAAFLEKETAKIDILIEKCETAIKLLKERRTALISAAVTGKIDVRSAA